MLSDAAASRAAGLLPRGAHALLLEKCSRTCGLEKCSRTCGWSLQTLTQYVDVLDPTHAQCPAMQRRRALLACCHAMRLLL